MTKTGNIIRNEIPNIIAKYIEFTSNIPRKGQPGPVNGRVHITINHHYSV